MGFCVHLETDQGHEKLSVAPDGGTYGKPVLAFLVGLQSYCDGFDRYNPWWVTLMEGSESTGCTTCKAILDSMYTNGGDSYHYYESEYAVYKLREPDGWATNEEEFKEMIRVANSRYQPIQRVIEGIEFLLKRLEERQPEPLEGFYDPQHTMHDFEALLTNLRFLEKRGNETVRLNFV